MNNKTKEIERLLKLISADNKAAFTEFFDLLYLDVFRFVRYFLHSTDVEEVVSEIFVSLWNNRTKLVSILNFNAYLYTIARNQAYAYLRMQNKIQNISLDDMPVTLCIDEESAEGRMIEDEMIHTFNQAVAELPERCKLVFLMVREEKLKYKEIAEIMQISTGTIEQHMNLAIKRITETMEIHYPGIISNGTMRKKISIA